MASEKESITQVSGAARQVSGARRRRKRLPKYLIRVTFRVLKALVAETETVLGRIFLSTSFKNDLSPVGMKFFASHELPPGADLELQFDKEGQTSIMIRVMACQELLPGEYCGDLNSFKYRVDAVFLADSVSNKDGSAERLVNYSEMIWKYVKGVIKL